MAIVSAFPRHRSVFDPFLSFKGLLANRAAKAKIALAREHGRRGDHPAAIAACREAVALRADKPWFHNELGRALTHDHDYWLNPALAAQLVGSGGLAEAIACWQRAVALGLRSSHTELSLGHALTALGDFAAATRHLRAGTDLLVAEKRPDLATRWREPLTARGPDFLIIGGTKCGTTSLYEYLCDHPQVLPAIWKEIEYFRFPERGREWYLAHFPRLPHTGTWLTGEASTCYFAMAEVKHLIRAAYPNVRLIALVRDPVAKAISHCHHDRKLGCEQRSVAVALQRELDLLEGKPEPWRDAGEFWRTERGYVWLGLYAPFLEDWLRVFPREQLLILPSDDLYRDPATTLARVHAHLGLPDHHLPGYPIHLEGSYDKKRVDEDAPLRARLTRFFQPYQERLEALIGQRLPWPRE